MDLRFRLTEFDRMKLGQTGHEFRIWRVVFFGFRQSTVAGRNSNIIKERHMCVSSR